MSNPGPASQGSTIPVSANTSPSGVGYQLGNSPLDLVGAFGAAPVVQPSPSGNATTVAAGSTTEAFTNTTYSGGVGSTGYAVGDIVAALKALGFLAK